MLECVILALVFLANLRGIACQEAAAANPDSPCAAAHTALLTGNILTLAVILFMIQRGSYDAALAGPATASLVGVALLAVLHRMRARVSPEAYRVLADVAVIAPLWLVWL